MAVVCKKLAGHSVRCLVLGGTIPCRGHANRSVDRYFQPVALPMDARDRFFRVDQLAVKGLGEFLL